MEAFIVYHCSADSYHSVPTLPIAVFTGPDAELRATKFAEKQPGYGVGYDWFVKPVALNPVED